MIVTVTERATFKRCRWQWAHASHNGLNLEVIRPKPALMLGSLIHQTLYKWILEPNLDPEHVYIQASAQALDNIKASYASHVHVSMSDSEIDPILDTIHLGYKMIVNYRDYYHTPLPPEFTFCAPEQTIVVPIPNTSHYLKGTLDGLVRDAQGTIYILEHKTFGQHPDRQTLDETDQFLAYMWLTQQLNIGPVGGLLYDGLWKRESPPGKRPIDDLFLRTLLQRPQVEIALFESELIQEVTEMANPNLPIYKNRTWQGCWDCDFRALCVTHSRGEDYDYALRTYFQTRPEDADLANE